MPRKFTHHRSARAPRKAGFRFGGKPMLFVFTLLVALFGAGYLMQINAASTKGVEIRKLEGEISELKEQGERIELKVAKEQSVQAVETKVREMGMVPTPKIDYVMAAVPQVARK
ncbi:MAG TPA: hypothetical protein VL283_01425 [Candidatus Baltobacteraceae bacterium]|nr:hypothetical protein [Candidatus Baltobacteraceae bacterium]